MGCAGGEVGHDARLQQEATRVALAVHLPRLRAGKHRAVAGDPHRGGADGGLGEQVADVGERERPGAIRRIGAVDVDRGRPDLVDEGLGVTGEPVESAQSAVPSELSASVESELSASGTSAAPSVVMSSSLRSL